MDQTVAERIKREWPDHDIDVVIPLDALLGLQRSVGAAPTQLGLLRTAQADDSWMPAAELRDLIAAGADVARADLADLDHATPFNDGGGSTRENLGALCRHHHRHKTHRPYRVIDGTADGACTLIAPSGLAYERTAQPVLPDEQDVPPF